MDTNASETGAEPAGRDALVGQVLLDKLRVDSVLGRGGMGTVYRVTHLGTRHQRALKVLNPEIKLNQDALVRFQREATVSGVLKSAFVVETLDTGQLPDGSLYVLMELLDGAPLSSLVEKGALPLVRIASLLRQACRALALAHEQGIVHRDIKPENLFVVTGDDGAERIKILDFGIARFRQPGDALGAMTGDHVVLGTPLYMAPEQIGNANQADGRADVYALGVVLYEALSGRKPYDASTFAELVARIYEGTSTPLERTAPGLTPFAYDVVRRAMARRPEDRFQTARELEAALAALESPMTPPLDLDLALGATAPSVMPPRFPPPARVPDFGVPQTIESVRPPSEAPSGAASDASAGPTARSTETTPSAPDAAPRAGWWPVTITVAVALGVAGLALGTAAFPSASSGTAETPAGAPDRAIEATRVSDAADAGAPSTATGAGATAGRIEPADDGAGRARTPRGDGDGDGHNEEGPGRRAAHEGERPPRGPRDETTRAVGSSGSSGGLAGPDEVYGGHE